MNKTFQQQLQDDIGRLKQVIGRHEAVIAAERREMERLMAANKVLEQENVALKRGLRLKDAEVNQLSSAINKLHAELKAP